MQLQALVFTPLAQPGSRSLVCDALVARQYRMREVRDVAGLLESVQSRAADVIVLGAGPGDAVDAMRFAMRAIDQVRRVRNAGTRARGGTGQRRTPRLYPRRANAAVKSERALGFWP